MSTFIDDLQSEVKELQKHGLENSLVVVNAFLDNPEKRLFVSIGKLVDALSGEIDELTDTKKTGTKEQKAKASILDGEDKRFERLNTIIIRYAEYCNALKSGKDISGMAGEKEEDDEDFLTNQAKKHQKAEGK